MKKQYKLSFVNKEQYLAVIEGLQIVHAVEELQVQTGTTEQDEPVYSTRYHVHLIAEEAPVLNQYIDLTTTGHVYPMCEYEIAMP